MLSLTPPFSPEVYRFMEESEHIFQLTGSRFFGPARADSDWDFFVQHEDTLKQKLLNMGFRIIDHYYDDSNIVATLRKGNIDIQLVKDFDKKVRVQDALKKINILTLVPKRLRKDVWNFAFSLIS